MSLTINKKEFSMRLSPVSFGSLMVFSLNDKVQKHTLSPLMRVSFNNNKQLKKYQLEGPVYYPEKIDGTVHNAAKNFAELLDKKYEKELPKGSKKVILTEVDFYVNPTDTQKRYFLTAPSNEEYKIHDSLSSSSLFYCAKFKR